MVPRIKNILLFLLAIIPYIYLTNRLFLLEPPVWPDEAVFTDVAKTFIRTGHIATQIYGGAIYNTAAHFYFYPPAYFLTLSAWIRMFGPGIESVRLMSSFIGLLSLVLFWIYIVRLFHSRTLAVAGTVMLSIDSYFGLSSRTARMEIVVFFLFISTLIVIDIAFQRKSALWYLAGGILASCAVMTHPLGIMVVALAVFAVIARHRKIDTDVIWVLLPPALAAAGWFISMGKNFPMFIYQVGINFAYKNAEVPHIFTLFGQGIFWQISMVCIGLIIAIQTLVVIQKRKYSDIFVLGGFVISVLFVLWGKGFLVHHISGAVYRPHDSWFFCMSSETKRIQIRRVFVVFLYNPCTGGHPVYDAAVISGDGQRISPVYPINSVVRAPRRACTTSIRTGSVF